MTLRYFSDNILVGRLKAGSEFFSVSFGDKVRLTRYCVPGRMDVYSFELENDGSIRFFSDGVSLSKGYKLIVKDLGRASVCDLLKRACEQPDWRGSARSAVSLLAEFGNTKAYRVAKKAQEKTLAEYVAAKAIKRPW